MPVKREKSWFSWIVEINLVQNKQWIWVVGPIRISIIIETFLQKKLTQIHFQFRSTRKHYILLTSNLWWIYYFKFTTPTSFQAPNTVGVLRGVTGHPNSKKFIGAAKIVLRCRQNYLIKMGRNSLGAIIFVNKGNIASLTTINSVALPAFEMGYLRVTHVFPEYL